MHLGLLLGGILFFALSVLSILAPGLMTIVLSAICGSLFGSLVASLLSDYFLGD